jgi:hypothetical protein
MSTNSKTVKTTTMHLKTKACFQTATGFSPDGTTAGFVQIIRKGHVYRGNCVVLRILTSV